MRRWLGLVAVVAAMLVALLAMRTWRFVQVMTQHANTVNAIFPRQALREHRELHGAYPKRLSDLPDRPDRRVTLDEYGTPYGYITDGRRFVLVSFGRDGRPDRSDYWPLRETAVLAGKGYAAGSPASTCGEPDRDMVLSDRGFHQTCAVK